MPLAPPEEGVYSLLIDLIKAINEHVKTEGGEAVTAGGATSGGAREGSYISEGR